MVCPTIKLLTSSVILSLSSGGCALFHPLEGPGPGAFCALYTQVIVAKGDSAAFSAKGPIGPQRRTLVNEKLYRTCPKPGS